MIDRSELKEYLYACETNGRPLYVMELHERLAVIDEVDAIIEADKEGEQEWYKEAICDVMRIVDDADKKAGDKTYIVLDDGTFCSQAKYIKEKMLELL